MSLLCRYTFGKPVTGKLTVNMTVNGVGYYRHEMGHPVIKTMEVSLFNPYSTCFVNVLETSKLIWKQGCWLIVVLSSEFLQSATVLCIHCKSLLLSKRLSSKPWHQNYTCPAVPDYIFSAVRSKALQISVCVSKTWCPWMWLITSEGLLAFGLLWPV